MIPDDPVTPQDTSYALADEPTDGALLGGRYQLGDLLGVGSSAAVFEATDLLAEEDSQPLAVKVLHAHLCEDPAVLTACLREGGATAKVRHPQVVGVHEWGTHEAGGVTVGWLVLDRVDGRTLSSVVTARGRLEPPEALEVMYGMLDGLAAIHEAGLVHRDVTPRNILVSGDVHAITRDQVYVADLGLADLTGSTSFVADHEVVGTPAYISPEQAMGHAVDPRADLYQAGALLHFLLTGLPPYPRSTTEKIVHAHLFAPPAVPSARVPAAAPLDRVVTKALSKRPETRFQSAAEFRAALEAAVPRVARAVETPTDATAVLPTAASAAAYLSSAATSAPPFRPARRGNRAGIVAALVIAFLVMVPVVQTLLPGAASAASSSPPAISSAPAVMGVVPRLTGTVQDAQGALAAQGYGLGQVTQRNSNVSEGQLLEQHPEAGSLTPRGTAVDLVVASGKNVVPQVAGLPAVTAGAKLKAAGFVASGITGNVAVSGTAPAAGLVVRIGTSVALLPAAAPTPTPVTIPTPSPTEPTVEPPSPTDSASPARTPTPSPSSGA